MNEDQLRKALRDIQMKDDWEPRLRAGCERARTRRPWRPKGAAVALIACLLLVVVCLPYLALRWQDDARLRTAPRERQELTYAASYDDVYQAIKAAAQANRLETNGSRLASLPEMGEMAVDDIAVEEKSQINNEAEDGASEFSGTNIQVAGVDEGDIVKTDGEYLYILRQNKLLIVEAAGAETAVLSTTAICEETAEVGVQEDRADRGGGETPLELYLCGDYVAVVTQYALWQYSAAEGYKDSGTTNLYIYDASDPAAPRRLHELGQDGYNRASRLIDDKLYLVTNHYVANAREGDIETYVPALYREEDSRPVDVDCIAIMPVVDTAAYTVISVYDLATGELTANQTVLGGGDTVYMNRQNLYLASSHYEQTVSDPYRDGGYTVTDHVDTNTTEIVRFDVGEGALTLAATGKVPGSLRNQFSLDEYDGHLRLVATVSRTVYSIYKDEQHGWENYRYDDSANVNTNALYVLDGDLQVVGSVEDLAPDESVYSVRFDGETGYFVTFRQVDPLFAVDLSDPQKPQVLSALKIPGFSEYLHVYSEGRLFGLGMDADETTGVTEGMKMTMFNTADPRNVTEKYTMSLHSRYSAALANHKAILIAPDKDIIAFPVDDGYAVYGYSDDNGFYQRAHVALAEEWYSDARGLYIDDIAYVVMTDEVFVFDLTTFKAIATVDIDA